MIELANATFSVSEQKVYKTIHFIEALAGALDIKISEMMAVVNEHIDIYKSDK